ncbi:hypothetical protein ACFVTY_24730 [Streptomyces sp. NPDC058067]|uniref:hypothetical protein n=1 Tax=Streptomyces sp. NPDC058067 TaxID=3346324 RepID=UPI0036E28011
MCAAQHEAVAEAVVAGESDRARTLMAEHIDMTAQQFRQEIWRRVVPGDGART